MRYLSLFSGIEAATVAWHPLGWQPVAFAEVDAFPSAVLAHHYPDVPNLGDVSKITAEQIAALGPIDLVVFGSPCQDFSIAGKRAGLEGARSGLFSDAIRLVQYAREHCGCRFALWENVPGAFSSNKGADFAAVVAALAGSGPLDVPPRGWGTEGVAVGEEALVEWCVLDAQWFGVAQRRRRVFALADFGNWTDRPPVLLESESLRGNTAPRREAGQGAATYAARCARSGGEWPAEIASTLNAAFGKKQGLEDQHALSGAPLFVPAHAFDARQSDVIQYGDKTGPLDTDCHSIAVAHSLRGEGFDASEDGTGRGTPLVPVAFSAKDHGADAGEIAPTLRAMGHGASHADGGGQVAVAVALRGREGGSTAELGDECGHTLRASSGGGDKPHVLAAMQVRRLTPRECERLQGFPDDYTLIRRAGKPAADGPRYKALGNSMAVPCMRWIGESIMRALA